MENDSKENLAELLSLRKVVTLHGKIQYYNKDNQLHRINGPAVICTSGSTEWWVEGQLHREDGPAIEWPNGSMAWFFNGEKHRIGGPATIWIDRSMEWWEYGKFIRSETC